MYTLYSVTCEWETRREDQMVETLLIVASSHQAAERAGRKHIEERTGYDPTADSVAFMGEIASVVIGTLMEDANGKYKWVLR